MVQILPYIQSPLEQLTPHIQQGAQALGQGLGINARNKADQPLIQQLQSGQLSPIQYQTMWGQLSESARKKFEPFLQSNLRMQEAQGKQDIKNNAELSKEQKTNEIYKQELAPVFDNLERLSKEVGGNFGFKSLWSKLPWTDAAAKREELDTEGVWAVDKVYTHFNKGVLNNAKWGDVKGFFAANSKLTDAQNRGRINALRRITGLPPGISPEKLNSIIDKEKKSIENSDKKQNSKVSEKFENRNNSGTVMIISPITGKSVPIPQSEVEAAIAAGGKLA